ncbi:MAG TPA: peptide-methionine (S)-S-oxide reductase MsrA [Gemmatimonadota bacterium]|jgi:methionine-S-sulfoxide reductase|nr:peptide-methionine (S)-S-oxide reductase MsrA [Gemmatimonadota bacterium]
MARSSLSWRTGITIDRIALSLWIGNVDPSPHYSIRGFVAKGDIVRTKVIVVLVLALSGLAVAAVLDRSGGEPTAAGAGTARDTAQATFAGGCFWCVEEAFDKVPGVVSTTSGYTGGRTPDPSYDQVSAGGTGHAEAVWVVYDTGVTTYEKLLEAFWRNIDPTDGGGQFCDRGDSYRSAIFTHGEEQARLAEASKRALDASGRFDEPIATAVVPAGPFYPAEEYHQDYYRKNPVRYKLYKWNCRRAQRLEQIWGEQS